MSDQDAKGAIFYTYEELVDLLSKILERNGAPTAIANMLASNCATAQRDGAEGHGLFRMSGYVSTLNSGYVDVHAKAIIEPSATSVIRVNANNGFAQMALALATPGALELVREHGIALISIRNSHHLGALWIDVEPFARQGLIAISCVNGISRVAPFGGRVPFYGTNPFAFAVPRSGADPLVVDQASSALSFGELKIAQREGHSVAPGVGIDQKGQPSTDPDEILNGGALLTFGGYKGSAISMMVELLAGALTGGQFSFEVDRSAYPDAQTSRSGQLMILIDPQHTSPGPDSYADRVEALIAGLLASGQSRMPGDRRYAHRKAADTHGIPVDDAMHQALQRFLVE